MRTFFMILLSLVMLIFHLLLAPAIAVFGTKIDFVMISVILLALFSGKWYPPVFCALYSGIAVDILTQPGTFINTGVYLAVSVMAFILFLLIKENNFMIALIAVFAAVAFKHLAFVLLLYVMRLSQSASIATFVHGLPAALYTAVTGLGLYFLYRALFRAFFMQKENGEKEKFFLP